jgi:hypothetical protein
LAELSFVLTENGIGSKRTSKLNPLVAFSSGDLLAINFCAYSQSGVQKEYPTSIDKTVNIKAYLLHIISVGLSFVRIFMIYHSS